VQKAHHLSSKDYLVTFGVEPNYPETGYGYIEKGDRLATDGFTVKCFHEKPTRDNAEKMLATQKFYWNSGMFLFKASILLAELEKYHASIYELMTQALEQATTDQDFLRPDKQAFEACPSISIDYAVMEQTQKAAVVPLTNSWSDLGSWEAIWEHTEKNADNNALKGNVITKETSNSLIYGNKRLITTLGIDNLLVIDTQDALLVADKRKSQDIKSITHILKEQNAKEMHHHTKVLRPWGWYETITECERFLVKRILVQEGKSLSLQMHHHRSEHWVVVKGTAKVTKGEESFLLAENQSTYIPIGVVHRLENVGKMPLEIIEVQSGSYLSEEDIVRFEDQYGRVSKTEKSHV